MRIPQPQRWLRYVVPVLVIVVVATAVMTRNQWWPLLNHQIQQVIAANRATSTTDHALPEDHADAEHDHAAHEGHSEEASLELSAQALQNLGLTGDALGEIQLTTFHKSITVPAVVTERSGQTRIQLSAPMTGVITRIHAAEGEAIAPGSLLFEIRLTHEDLVRVQTEFVQTLGELDIEQREIARLSELATSGGVARKTLLEREYARDKLQSLLAVQREALRLHGLSEEHVQTIAETRRLLADLKLYSPGADGDSAPELKLSQNASTIQVASAATTRLDAATPFVPVSQASSTAAAPLILRDLLVRRGQAVTAGEPLGTLVNYSELYIEGMAFEQDVVAVSRASQNNWPVTAIISQADGATVQVEDLEIAWLDSEIERASRTLKFYVHLPNELLKSVKADTSPRFVNWRFRPGQRLQVRIPTEKWEQQIVLPVEAVAREGAESFVFQQNGDHFDRLPVHVKYRDQHAVVIANDGQLYPGDVVARKAAHQMQMALKNKAGGAVDPHAGHSH